MFKKGQLVRSKVTERVFEVLVWPTIRVVDTGEVFRLNHSSVDLIGNNYQAKPKCSRLKISSPGRTHAVVRRT